MNRILPPFLKTYPQIVRTVKSQQNLFNKNIRCLSDNSKDKTPAPGTLNNIEQSEVDDKFDDLITKVSGFAKAYEKQEESLKEKKVDEVPQTFAQLLRNSPLIDVSIYN